MIVWSLVCVAFVQRGSLQLPKAAMADLVVSYRGVAKTGKAVNGKVPVVFTWKMQNNTAFSVSSFKFRMIGYGRRTWQSDGGISGFGDPGTRRMGPLAFSREVDLRYAAAIPEDVWNSMKAYWIEPLSATGTPLANVTQWRAITALPLPGKSSPLMFGSVANIDGTGFRAVANVTRDGSGTYTWSDSPRGARFEAITSGKDPEEKRVLARPGDDGRAVDIRFTAPRDGIYVLHVRGWLRDGAMAAGAFFVDGKRKYGMSMRNDGFGMETAFPLPLQKGHRFDIVWTRYNQIDEVRIGFALRVIGGPKS